MPERRRHPLDLACGRTIELRFRRLAGAEADLPARDGALYACAQCGRDRVQLIACGHVHGGRVAAQRRCPDCEAYDAGAWPAAAFAAYEGHLRTGLEALAATVDRLERDDPIDV